MEKLFLTKNNIQLTCRTMHPVGLVPSVTKTLLKGALEGVTPELNSKAESADRKQ